MVTLTIDSTTYEALCRQAAARGLSVEDWLKSQSVSGNGDHPPEPPVGEQMAQLFSEVGLADDESIPEWKREAVRSVEFE